MDTARYIQSCNPARFVVTSSLLIFSILLAARLDGYVSFSYWIIFLPLFAWKMLTCFGAFVGIFYWCKNGDRRRTMRTLDNDCRALMIYFFLHLLIFVFEILVCHKLETKSDTQWITCFTPLYVCIFLAFLSCLWSLKVQRNFLVQAFISANGLFFLFFPLRLDSSITWRYIIVFIPLWISLCIALLFVISKLILAIVHDCSHRIVPGQRESSTLIEAASHLVVFVPFSIFAILLASRLDLQQNEQLEKTSFTVIAIPLWISLVAWLSLSFGANDFNPWWFGIRHDLCDIVSDHCPFVTLYCNNRFKFEPRPSMTMPSNNVAIDLAMPNVNKNLGSISVNKSLPVNFHNEQVSDIQPNSMLLLEPD